VDAQEFKVDVAVRAKDDKPPLVSRDVWDSICLEDRPDVRRKAAKLYCKGVLPDEAIRLAVKEVTHARVLHGEGAVSDLVRGMLALVPDDIRTSDVEACLVTGALAAMETARKWWQDILAADKPLHAAWYKREWHSVRGRCMITNIPTSEFTSDYHSGGDFINKKAQAFRKDLLRLFSESVLRESERLAEEAKAAEFGAVNPEPVEVPHEAETEAASSLPHVIQKVSVLDDLLD
jgi:hypothetical protein